MWRIDEITSGSSFVIQLCHDSAGQRYFQLRETTNTARNPDMIFETEVVPNELLKQRNMERIAEEAKLSGGGTFEVDAHNIWYTPDELDALEENDDSDSIPWCTSTPPVLPS